MGVQLSWTASAGATYYMYCISPKPNCPGNIKKWITLGNKTSTTTAPLLPNTVYYWQVRAYDNNNNFTEANSGAWWRFKTQPTLGAFAKMTPANTALDQPINNLVLQWSASANATGYPYCIYSGTVNPCGTANWISLGNITQVTIYILLPNTLYTWQVRAVNGNGTLQADAGTWWTFTTAINMPSAFSKLSPTDTAINEPVDLHLTWSPSGGTDRYDYCISATPACTTGWTSAGTSTDVVPFPALGYNQTYYWQVRAHNAQGDTYANTDGTADGAWWSFTTIQAQPTSFSKINPMMGANYQPLDPWLYWSDSVGASSYSYCVTTTATCTNWTVLTVNPLPTSVQAHGLSYHTTYNWQVQATNNSGTVEANTGTYWSFTTLYAPPATSNQTFTTPEDTLLNGQLIATSTDPTATLTFSLYNPESAGILHLNPNGSFDYKPPLNYNGPITFQFTVWDGHNAPVGPFIATINVTAVNDPPVLTPLADPLVVTSGDVISFTVTATDPDIPYGDVLTFLTPANLPADATFDPASGSFIWSPLWSNTQPITYAITFVVKDLANTTDQQTVHITVNPMKLMLPVIRR